MKPNDAGQGWRRAVPKDRPHRRSNTKSSSCACRAGAGQAAGKPAAEQPRPGCGHCIEGLNQQLAFNQKRLSDISSLRWKKANSEFRQQDTQVQVETVSAQLQAAKAAQANAKLALDAEIGGINPAVAQVAAQLDDAQWQLEQTTIRAPADGVVTIMALASRRPSGAGQAGVVVLCSAPMSCWSACSRRMGSTPSSRGCG